MPYHFVPATFDLGVVHELHDGQHVGRSLDFQEMSDGALCDYDGDLDSFEADVQKQLRIARVAIAHERQKRGIAA